MSALLSPDSRTFIYCLDAADRIVTVNDAWLEFAGENDAPHLTRAAVLRRPVWDFVTGADTQVVYALILQRVRAAQATVRIDFRCDSPTLRRFMNMEVSPLAGNHLRLSCRMSRLESRPAVTWPAPGGRAPRRMVVMCSWCKRVEQRPGEWGEVEEAVALLEMGAEEAAPAITHGICPECAETWMKQVDAVQPPAD